MKIQKIDSNANNLYPVYYCSVSNIRELAKITFPTKHFSLLVCADFRDISTKDISHAIEALIKEGNLYFCAWGPDCEHAHDIYDEVIVINKIQYGSSEDLIMTTWHDKESLDDVLWFILYNAALYEKDENDCSTIIVSINNNEWRNEILDNLSNIEAFNQRVLAEGE